MKVAFQELVGIEGGLVAQLVRKAIELPKPTQRTSSILALHEPDEAAAIIARRQERIDSAEPSHRRATRRGGRAGEGLCPIPGGGEALRAPLAAQPVSGLTGHADRAGRFADARTAGERNHEAQLHRRLPAIVLSAQRHRRKAKEVENTHLWNIS